MSGRSRLDRWEVASHVVLAVAIAVAVVGVAWIEVTR